MKSNRREQYFNYFEKIAPSYSKYKKKFGYYYSDIVSYCNYFLTGTESIIEIGCGTGETISKLNGQNKTGLDFSPSMIAEARKKFPEINFICEDAEELQLTEKYDVVVLSNVIGYFDNVLDALNSIKKICKPETRIFISYYNYFWEPVLKLGEFFGIKKKSLGQSWLTIQDINNLLYLGGFETFRSARRILIPFYIPLISFLFNKILARLPFFNYFCLNQFVFARLIMEPGEELQQFSTTVVIPARNESENIENAILRMPNFGKHTEIIFVEGNSTDNTWDKINEIQQKYKDTHDIKIAKQDGKGKGDAVRKGYNMATGDILMILDADLTVPPEELPKFYNAIATRKAEFINGSRLIYPMEKNAMRPLNTIGNKFFSVAFSWLLEQPIKDTLCGTKVMFRKDYEKLAQNRVFFGNFDPFGDFDLIFGAYKLNLKIIDLPIRYRERVYGTTNISRFKHGFLLLKMVIFAATKIKFY